MSDERLSSLCMMSVHKERIQKLKTDFVEEVVNAFLFKIEKLNFVKNNLNFVFIFCYNYLLYKKKIFLQNPGGADARFVPTWRRPCLTSIIF